MEKIDSNTIKKVMDVLSDPEMMSKISALASGSTPQPEQTTPQQDQITPQTVQSAPTFSFGNTSRDSRADLLLALKPLLKENKRSKIDAVVKALTVASAVSKMKGGNGNV